MTEAPQSFAPGVFGLIGGAVNVFVLDDAQSGVTVIDAGLPGTARRVLALVRAIGRTPQDVKHILVTHADLDHIGGLKALVDATGAAVYASAESERYIRSRKNPPHVPSPMRWLSTVVSLFTGVASVTHQAADGDLLPIAGGIRVIATPGHTPDHVSYFWELERVLFTGDLFNNRRGLALTPPGITWSRAAAQQSARRVLELAPTVLCMGHGPVWRAFEAPEQLEALRTTLGEAN